MPDADALMSITDLNVSFGSAHVLHDVTLSVAKGHTLGLVGESGSGKSTVAKVLVGVVKPTSGDVSVAGYTLGSMSRRDKQRFHRTIQMIPQDPFSSLSPRMTIGQSIAEAIDPAHLSVKRNRDKIAEAIEKVKLDPDVMNRYPHEFSGGQRQRIAVARALSVHPEFIIADEITSALDVSVQAQILDLIAELKTDLGITMVFISHNLAVVQEVSDEVAVMYHGHIVEWDTADRIYGDPQHWYTRRLLDSVPGAPGFDLAVS